MNWVVVAALLFGMLLLYAIAGALFGRSSNESAERTAERAGDRLERATGGLLSLSRVILVTAFSLTVTFAAEGALFLGEIASAASQSPMVFGQFVIAGLGYVAAAGNVMTPVEFAVLAAVTIIVAAGVAYS